MRDSHRIPSFGLTETRTAETASLGCYAPFGERLDSRRRGGIECSWHRCLPFAQSGVSPMQNSPHGPHPRRPPLPATDDRRRQPLDSLQRPRRRTLAAPRLLRLTWLLVCAAFVILLVLIGTTALLLHDRASSRRPRPNPPGGETRVHAPRDEGGPPIPRKDAESELLGIDDNPAPTPRPPHLAEAERVLGHTLKPPEADDSLPPPWVPSPKREAKPNPPSLSPAKPPETRRRSTAPAGQARRVGCRGRVPETVTSDGGGTAPNWPPSRNCGCIAIWRSRASARWRLSKSSINSRGRAELEYAFNLSLNQSLRKAAVLSGLPVQSGPNCRLDPAEASIVQTLSKDLRDMGFVSVPGTAVRLLHERAGGQRRRHDHRRRLAERED